MPLPLDLASVAWLIEHDYSGERTAKYWRLSASTWYGEVVRLKAIMRDREAYIRSLEDQLAPHLVRVIPEQEAML